jgi:hypothetical protein
MTDQELLATAGDFAIAILLGALIRIEREKRKSEEDDTGHVAWLLVILISSLSLVGYVLTRWLGPTRGAALTGLTGGLVSSTAVTLSFSKEAREKPQEATALAWHPAFLDGDVRAGHSAGGDRQSCAADPCAGSVYGDGCHRRLLRSVSLFSRRIAQRQACQKEFESRESA